MNKPVFRLRDTARARLLRREMSPAERHLWRYISRNQIGGHHFTKQFQVGPYFADFACRKACLLIEIDGFSHDARIDYDAHRDAYLRGQGYRVLRFTNEEVFSSVEGVVSTIASFLAVMPSPNPSRKREGR